jgi:hypothetical protein
MKLSASIDPPAQLYTQLISTIVGHEVAQYCDLHKSWGPPPPCQKKWEYKIRYNRSIIWVLTYLA